MSSESPMIMISLYHIGLSSMPDHNSTTLYMSIVHNMWQTLKIFMEKGDLKRAKLQIMMDSINAASCIINKGSIKNHGPSLRP